MGRVTKMVHHRHKQVEEQWRATLFHLHLHRPAALECASTPDDESEVVRSELRVTCRCVRVSVPCRRQYSRALHPSLQSLLLERQPLQLWQTESVRGAIDNSILQNRATNTTTIHRTLALRPSTSTLIVEKPARAFLVVDEFGRVVALVKVLQHGGEDLGLLIGEFDPLAGA